MWIFLNVINNFPDSAWSKKHSRRRRINDDSNAVEDRDIGIGLTEVEEAVVNFGKHFLLISAHLNKWFAGEHSSYNNGSARFRHPETGCGGVGYNPQYIRHNDMIGVSDESPKDADDFTISAVSKIHD